MSHAVAEPPRKSHGGNHGHGGHSASHADRMRIFDHLPVMKVPEGFTAPEPIVHDPRADHHHHHHHDHSEQDHQIKEILGESPVVVATNTFAAIVERIAAPVWHMLARLGIHVY